MSVYSELWRPHATVATIVERQGRFLMVEECVRGTIVLNQPAGHIDPGETIAQAAVRETLEETGWQVTLTGLVGFYVLRFADSEDAYHRYCFTARAEKQVSTSLDSGILRALWLSEEEVHSGKHALRSTLVTRCLQDYRARKEFPLDLIFETL